MKYGLNELDDEDVDVIFVPIQSQDSKRPDDRGKSKSSLRNMNKSMTLAKTALFSLSIFLLVGGNDGWRILESMKSFTCYAFGLECCRPPYFKGVDAIPNLKKSMRGQFFGQHLAVQTVTRALDAHLRDDKPGKALVFSFHGWAGSGKTFLSELIAKSLYQKGTTSSFMKFYMATIHFPDKDEKMVKIYQEKVREDILKTLRKCEHAMFVFDEVDKTPPGVFEAVIPFIIYPGKFDGRDHKKAIFIFLSNTGSTDITEIALQAWKDGKSRDDLTFKDFEEYMSRDAFNQKASGLYRSGLIDHFLVDYFIPFLPMERTHIIQCIKSEARRLGGHEDSVNVTAIADSLTYWPPELKLYSATGCRKVEGAVKYQLADTDTDYEDDDEDIDNVERKEL